MYFYDDYLSCSRPLWPTNPCLLRYMLPQPSHWCCSENRTIQDLVIIQYYNSTQTCHTYRFPFIYFIYKKRVRKMVFKIRILSTDRTHALHWGTDSPSNAYQSSSVWVHVWIHSCNCCLKESDKEKATIPSLHVFFSVGILVTFGLKTTIDPSC